MRWTFIDLWEIRVNQGIRHARRAGLCAIALAALMLGGCSNSTSGTEKTPNQLSWCDQKNINFQDSSVQGGTALTDWSTVKPQLGFTVYLPPTLPKDACLALAGGAIHDPIFGGQMNITWELGTKGPIAFSEAPRRAGVSETVQCVQSGQDAKTTICVGAIKNTSVTVAGRLASSELTGYFNNLKADVDWVPAGK
jgi:hypothetical protein